MDPTYRKIQELLNATQLLAEELEIVYDILDNLFEEEDYDLSAPVLLEKKKWIQKAIKKEGSLRKTMKAKKGKNIPASKLKKAAEKGGKTGKRARLALTLRKLNESEIGLVTQYNDADDKPGEPAIATQTDMVELLGSWDPKPVPFDVSTNEGLEAALRHMTDVEHTAAAADSSENISSTERAALARIREQKPRLQGLAKQRKLKVKLPSFYGGDIEVDFGKD